MSSEDSPAALVVRFLRTNNYPEALEAFLREANLPSSIGLPSSHALTIEQVLKEKNTFDVSQSFEKVSVEDSARSWVLPAPAKANEVELRNPSNVLHVTIERINRSNGNPTRTLNVSTAAKKLWSLSTTPPYDVDITIPQPSLNSPALSWVVLFNRYLLTTTMSGTVFLTDTRGSVDHIWSRRDHSKYVVAISKHEEENSVWIATAGWDAKIFLYRFSSHREHANLSSHVIVDTDIEPVASLALPTNPESILFTKHPDLEQPLLLLSRRDSTFLYYYAIPTELHSTTQSDTPATDPKSSKLPALPLIGRQNLAPHSNAWIAFTPSALALHPSDPSIIAVATSHVPHMKLIIARLLLPSADAINDAAAIVETSMTSPAILAATSGPIHNPTQASEARRLLAIQDREAAAILIQMSTLAPQTAYSTPALAWRPDGTGVWVNGDDGVVRGVEASSGKVVAVLKGGHEAQSKVRCLCAGLVGDSSEEIVVSGGFDRRLIVWRCE